MRRNISFRDVVVVFRHKADSEFIEYLMVPRPDDVLVDSMPGLFSFSSLSSPPLLPFPPFLSVGTSLKYAPKNFGDPRYKSSRRS